MHASKPCLILIGTNLGRFIWKKCTLILYFDRWPRFFYKWRNLRIILSSTTILDAVQKSLIHYWTCLFGAFPCTWIQTTMPDWPCSNCILCFYRFGWNKFTFHGSLIGNVLYITGHNPSHSVSAIHQRLFYGKDLTMRWPFIVLITHSLRHITMLYKLFI